MLLSPCSLKCFISLKSIPVSFATNLVSDAMQIDPKDKRKSHKLTARTHHTITYTLAWPRPAPTILWACFAEQLAILSRAGVYCISVCTNATVHLSNIWRDIMTYCHLQMPKGQHSMGTLGYCVILKHKIHACIVNFRLKNMHDHFVCKYINLSTPWLHSPDKDNWKRMDINLINIISTTNTPITTYSSLNNPLQSQSSV